MRIDAIAPSLFSAEIKSIEVDPKPAINFDHFLGDNLSETNHRLNAADQALQDLAMGKSENLHQTMMTMEEAKLSMQMLEQVRNRLMGAWQELLREQI